jgi:flagellin
MPEIKSATRHGCRENRRPRKGLTQGKSKFMVINTNIAALNGANNLDQSTNALNESLARLSSGSKIVNASDDPAGLAESMELNEQIGQTNASNANISNALAFSQTQDGYLQQVSAALNQMAALVTSASDGTKSASDIADYQTQFAALQSTIGSAMAATFNGKNLFGTSITTAGVSLSVDPSTDATNGAAWTASLTDTVTGGAAATDVAGAITALATARGQVGANETQLTYQGNELGVLSTNLAAAKSTITDVDVAQESTNYAKEQILVQSGTAMLAQANSSPQTVLKLLQG